MKKKDPKLEMRILDIATELFMKHCYADVDMRTIAKEAGCAVGTTYNYFASKDALYMEVFKRSWEKTIDKLDLILKSDKLAADKAADFLIELYQGKIDRRCLAREILSRSFRDENRDIAVKLRMLWEDWICSRLVTILSSNESKGLDKKYFDSLAATMIFSVLTLGELTSDKGSEHVEFIREYVRKIMA